MTSDELKAELFAALTAAYESEDTWHCKTPPVLLSTVLTIMDSMFDHFEGRVMSLQMKIDVLEGVRE